MEFLRSRKHWLILAGIVLLGIGIRCLCWRDTFQDGRVYFYANDSWYHMRRIVYALNNNFSLSDFPKPDPYLNYPEGGQGYWGPLFDLGIAGAIKTLGITERHNQEVLAAVIPAILGGLCALAAFLIASVFWDRRTAYFTAFFIALLPGHLFYSHVGHLDHHVAESLLFGFILYCTLSRTQAVTPPWKNKFVIANSLLILALYLITPSTSNIHMGVIWATVIIKILMDENDTESDLSAGYGFIAGGLLLLLPAFYFLNTPAEGIRLWSSLPKWLGIEWYSMLQPLLLIGGGAALCAAELGRVKQTKNPLFFTFIAVFSIAALIAAQAVFAGIGVLFKNNPDLKFTAEAQPLLFPSGANGINFKFAFSAFGFAFLLFPLWWWHVHLNQKAPKSLLAFCALLLLLVLVQLRFVYVFSYAMALAAGWTFSELFKNRKWWMAAAMILGLLFWPCSQWLYNLATRRNYTSVPKDFYNLCLWMKENTPVTSGYYRAGITPEYSTMAIWDAGHTIIYLAERAVVADPFNHGFEESAKYFTATDPREAVKVLKDKNVRFILPIDFTNEYVLKAYAAYARLPQDHPIYNGEWFRIFQTQLLMGIKPLGPDGKPSSWGHHLAHRSGNAALIEFDPF